MSWLFFSNVACRLVNLLGQGKKRWPVPFSARVAALIDTVVTFEGPNMWLDDENGWSKVGGEFGGVVWWLCIGSKQLKKHWSLKAVQGLMIWAIWVMQNRCWLDAAGDEEQVGLTLSALWIGIVYPHGMGWNGRHNMKIIPSWELTYALPMHFLKMNVFSQGGIC